MADVLIVCVREDEPRAKALAEMFETSGFSIGGAPGNDAALRSSGAGVIVWSQASIRSRAFLDASQRVINAGKAVVASLIEPPPPSSVGDAQTFDLSRWNGDPDDPALDPLFFSVDRMVNTARAAVGAEPAQPAPPAFEPPPSLRPPPPAPPPRPARAAPPPPAPASADPRGEESAHWRAIRDSRDPAVFLDFLARYGADGDFAELAELRLRQLENEGQARRAPAPAPRPAPPPPPPRRAEAPPPPRRAPAPAPAPTRRPPDIERRFERVETREPPRGEGGALRAFVLIALLGGAALAGALYFGGGIGEDRAEAPSIDVAAPPPLDGEPADGAGAEGEGLDELAAAPTPTAPPRRDTAQQQPAAPEEPEPPTPAPVTSWAATESANSAPGPVPLIPRDQPSTGSTAVVPIGPPQQQATPPQTQPAAVSPPQAARPAPAGSVVWTQRPSGRRITDLYPSRAQREGVGGRVVLDCQVLADLSVTCGVTSETPPGMGFARAALSAAAAYRARPTLSNGQSAVGANARIAVQFQPPQRE